MIRPKENVCGADCVLLQGSLKSFVSKSLSISMSIGTIGTSQSLAGLIRSGKMSKYSCKQRLKSCNLTDRKACLEWFVVDAVGQVQLGNGLTGTLCEHVHMAPHVGNIDAVKR